MGGIDFRGDEKCAGFRFCTAAAAAALSIIQVLSHQRKTKMGVVYTSPHGRKNNRGLFWGLLVLLLYAYCK